MSAPALAPAPSVALLAQADLLLAASRLFALPRADSSGEADALAASVDELVAAAGGAAARAIDGKAIGEAAAGLRAAGAPGAAALAQEYTRLFDTELACPINETAYVRRDKGAILGDIAGFYRAFGFALAEASGEKADHLACELEFFALLLVMQARAEAEKDREAAGVTRGAIESFAADHLGAWLPAFCARLGEAAAHPFYRQAGAFLDAAWGVVADAGSLPAAVPEPDPGSPDDPGGPYECGMAGEGPA